MRDRQVDEHPVSRLLVLAGEQDRTGRHERHQLPEAQERADVTRTHEPDERHQEHTRRDSQRPALPVSVKRVASEQRRRRTDDGHQYQEESAETVKAQRRMHITTKPSADRVSRDKHPRATNPEQGHPKRLRGQAATRRATHARAYDAEHHRESTRENQPHRIAHQAVNPHAGENQGEPSPRSVPTEILEVTVGLPRIRYTIEYVGRHGAVCRDQRNRLTESLGGAVFEQFHRRLRSIVAAVKDAFGQSPLIAGNTGKRVTPRLQQSGE